MLDTETKRRIDTARDILVGKVPDPKSQVEQITIALIYKFMDDMDLESEELGGERSFFKGDFEKYSWRRIFDPRMGGFEILNLYSEAIMKMNVNPNIPQLFRDIFKNAYLPYRDPETLKVFLKVINDFTYDHSEKLGDAFEYLLSVLGSQGEAGQFRTPRHIIDFMVEIIDPKKDETILDPACGTAGFLISSYKHIIKHNSSNYNPKEETKTFEVKDVHLDELTINSKKYSGDKLTPDERSRLAKNIKGYDISPDMVRLSLVNMYLHGLHSPLIHEYDTLTSEDKWNEYADVILANPPFMSPKGGIRPHKRFSITSKRSEVLFVDYIAEHLTPNGRAAVIVPEGVIFQSGTAYKNLRKMLVENYLVGVISLPAGVFQPYSGVKTSILWLDRTLVKKTDKILFIKIDNDGFDLGAQRRPIKQNDLPESSKCIKEYLSIISMGTINEFGNEILISKEEVRSTHDINLRGERYKKQSVSISEFPLIELGDESIFEIESGGTPKSQDPECWNGDIDWITLVDLPAENLISNIYKSERKITQKGLKTSSARLIPVNSIIVSTRATIGRIGINRVELATNQGFKNVIVKDPNRAVPEFVALMVTNLKERMMELASGGTFKELSKSNFKTLQIPLPPLSVQEEIVAEIESYQKIIDGARQVVENYKPRIDIDPEWPMVEFKDAPFEIIDGDRGKNYPKGDDFSSTGYCLFLNTKNVRPNGFNFDELMFVSKEKDEILSKGKLKREDVVLTTRGTVGNTAYYDDLVSFEHIRINSGMLIFRLNREKLIPPYLFLYFQTENCQEQFKKIISGAAQPQLPIRDLKYAKIPLPPIDIQKSIVKEIIQEQSLIISNKELIRKYEQKIKDRIAKVWGNEI